MPEHNDITLLSVQKELKPKIEDVILKCLDGDVKQTALDFVAHLRANKTQPAWSAHNSWAASYKRKKICTVRLASDHFPYKHWAIIPHISRWNKIISSYDVYYDKIINDGLRDIVWNNINFCRSCVGCGPGWDMTFLGRNFKNVCHNIPVWYCDPGKKEIDFIKSILELMKQTIAANKEDQK